MFVSKSTRPSPFMLEKDVSLAASSGTAVGISEGCDEGCLEGLAKG